MDKSWQGWVDENIGRGCDPRGMCEILLKYKFDLPQIRKMMGESFPEDMDRSAGGKEYILREDDGAASSPIAAKCQSLVEIMRDLARLSPRANAIERRSGVSGDEFLEKYYSANRPVILCGLMEFWRAPVRWTPEYLKSICGGEMIEIMAGRETSALYEIDAESHRKEIRFSEYVDMVTGGRKTNDYYLTARNGFFQRPAMRPLLKDIEIFTEYLKETSGDGMFMWYGPSGTVTPLHHDIMNIFMAQVQGRKHVKLIPANEIELVYNNFAVYSDIDPEHPDLERFPKYRYANVIDVELAPGEVLFLPVGWWHWVKALDVSITVAFNNFLFPNEFRWENPKGTGHAEKRY